MRKHINASMVDAIAMGTASGLRRRLRVTDTGALIQVPVGSATLGRLFNILGRCNRISAAGRAGIQPGRDILPLALAALQPCHLAPVRFSRQHFPLLFGLEFSASQVEFRFTPTINSGTFSHQNGGEKCE